MKVFKTKLKEQQENLSEQKTVKNKSFGNLKRKD